MTGCSGCGGLSLKVLQGIFVVPVCKKKRWGFLKNLQYLSYSKGLCFGRRLALNYGAYLKISLVARGLAEAHGSSISACVAHTRKSYADKDVRR